MTGVAERSMTNSHEHLLCMEELHSLIVHLSALISCSFNFCRDFHLPCPYPSSEQEEEALVER